MSEERLPWSVPKRQSWDPGGNVTGVTIIGVEMGPKRVELAHQLVPDAKTIAMPINSKFPMASAEMRDMRAAALSFGLKVTVLNASGEAQIDAGFAAIGEQKADALLINTDPLLLGQRDQIVHLAARHRRSRNKPPALPSGVIVFVSTMLFRRLGGT
jgi:putative tryptophan/tyrosine transport system substrate-binding protein